MSRNIEINIKQQNGEVTNYETLYPKTISKNILYSGEDSVTVWDKLNNLTPSTTFEIGDILLTSKIINLGTNQWLICDGSSVNIDLYPELKTQGNNFTLSRGTEEQQNIYPNSLLVYGKNSGLYYATAADISTAKKSVFFCKDTDDVSNINNWKAVEVVDFSGNYSFKGIIGGEKIGSYYFFLLFCPYISSGGNYFYYYVVLNENLERKFLSEQFTVSKTKGRCIWAGIIKESEESYDVCYQNEGANSSYPWSFRIYNINLTNLTWTQKASYSNRMNYLEKIDGVYYAYTAGTTSVLYSSTTLSNNFPSNWTQVSTNNKAGGVVGKIKDWYITSKGYCCKNYLDVFNSAQKFTNLINHSEFSTGYFWLQGNDNLIYYTPKAENLYDFYSYSSNQALIYEFDFTGFPTLKRTLNLPIDYTNNFLGYIFITPTDEIYSKFAAAGYEIQYGKIYKAVINYQLPIVPTEAQISGATYYIKVANNS